MIVLTRIVLIRIVLIRIVLTSIALTRVVLTRIAVRLRTVTRLPPAKWLAAVGGGWRWRVSGQLPGSCPWGVYTRLLARFVGFLAAGRG